MLADEGLTIVSATIFDHPGDRVFELRLRGPARQFDAARAVLSGKPDVQNVYFD